VTDHSEHGTKLSGSKNGEEFLSRLSSYQLLKKYPAPLNYLVFEKSGLTLWLRIHLISSRQSQLRSSATLYITQEFLQAMFRGSDIQLLIIFCKTCGITVSLKNVTN
jgi:hypothetical protein